jgi:hypothetical protein
MIQITVRGEVEIRSLSLLINCLVQVVARRAPLVCQFQPSPHLKFFLKLFFTTSITFLSSKVHVLFYTLIHTERKPHILFSNMSQLEAPASLPSLPAESISIISDLKSKFDSIHIST